MQNHMILLTGYSEKEYMKRQPDKNLKSCYRCKRTESDKTAVVFDGDVMFQEMEEFTPLSVRMEDKDHPVIFKFWLCPECFLLREAELSKNIMTFPGELFERNDI